MNWPLAQLKQEDVFKSISDNVSSSGDPKVFYVVALIGVGLVLLLVVANSMKKRQASPRAVNHQGKLMKEMLKTLALKKAEVKNLKIMAAGQQRRFPPNPVLRSSM